FVIPPASPMGSPPSWVSNTLCVEGKTSYISIFIKVSVRADSVGEGGSRMGRSGYGRRARYEV
ncbi:MAG: hypothetical protein M3Q60_23295, partial [Actinomycetota bacterium]|nr:hypothetical protein [Actinomycetota bacterium]